MTAAKDLEVSSIVEPLQQWQQVLRGGVQVLIRPLGQQDLELERRFLERLSPTSRRFRFLDTFALPSDALVKHLVEINPAREVAFLAVTVDETPVRQVGVARLCTDPNGRSCEIAITVSDDLQRKGLGTLLMGHLIDSAIARGITSMYSIDAGSNEAMRGFAHRRGFRTEMDPGDPTQVLHTLDLSPSSHGPVVTAQ